MKELIRVCDGKNRYGQKHKFSASESFKEITECPICHRPMELVEVETLERSLRRSGSRGRKRSSESMGLMRGQKIDRLPRFQWFSEAMEINDEDQEKSGETWTLNDAKRLNDLFLVVGDSTADTWKGMAEDMGRSLFAVERQLRIIKYCSSELERYYPNT